MNKIEEWLSNIDKIKSKREYHKGMVKHYSKQINTFKSYIRTYKSRGKIVEEKDWHYDESGNLVGASKAPIIELNDSVGEAIKIGSNDTMISARGLYKKRNGKYELRGY